MAKSNTMLCVNQVTKKEIYGNDRKDNDHIYHEKKANEYNTKP